MKNRKRKGFESRSSSPISAKNVSIDTPASNTRRKMVTRSLVGGSTLIGLDAVGWIKPVVDKVMVPAHAQTSGVSGNMRFDFSGASMSYTLPSGVSSVRAIAAGGGGGGGGGLDVSLKYVNQIASMAGAEGERLETVLNNLDASGETLSITVGAGGGAGGDATPSYGAGGFGYASGTDGVTGNFAPLTSGGGGGSSNVVASSGSVHASGGGGGGAFDANGGTGGGPVGGTGGNFTGGNAAQVGGAGGGGAGGELNDTEVDGFADSNGSPGYVIISWPP